jgi:predicted dehydrogenase
LSSGFYQEFVKAARAGASLPVQPAEILQVMKVIDAVRSSNAMGKTVPVP